MHHEKDEFTGNTTTCICGKPGLTYSGKFKRSFCSDKCGELMLRVSDLSDAKIVTKIETITLAGKNSKVKRGYFEQGDIKFQVNLKNLDKVLGAASYSQDGSVLDKLMDSQIVTLATANNLPVEPYVRELVLAPLRGILQLVWYRDVENHVSDHLLENQVKRVIEYLRRLHEYKPTVEGGEGRRTRSTKAWGHSFRVLQSKAIPKGRARQLWDVVATFKEGATFAQIVEAAAGKVKTKQDTTKIVNRFLRELLEANAIEEVK